MMGKVESNHFLQIPPQPVICKLSPASRVEDRNGSLNVFLITSKAGTAAQSGCLSNCFETVGRSKRNGKIGNGHKFEF